MPVEDRRRSRNRPLPAPTPVVPARNHSPAGLNREVIRQQEYGNQVGEFSSWEAPLFTNANPVPISTAPPMISVVRALFQVDAWNPVSVPHGLAPECHYKDRGGSIVHNITAEDPESGRLEYLVGEAAWSIVEEFGTPTAFLHLAFSAYAARQEKPWMRDMRIRGTDLINALGLGHRKDLSKAEKLGRIITQALLLNSLGVVVNWAKAENNRFVTRLSRMWEVSIDYIGQTHLATGEGRPTDLILDEVILHVRPGKWAELFLDRSGLKAGSSLFFIGYLARQVLQFDPYQEPIASKLAVLLTLTQIPNKYRRKVESLIEYAFSAEEREAAARGDKRQRYAIRQALDNALYSLSQAGWRLDFTEVSYPAYLIPAWARPGHSAPTCRAPRGYWPAFLSAVLEVRPPGNIPQRLAANRGFPPGDDGSKRPRTRPRKMTGEEIRQGRAAQGLTQRELGGILGKSRPWVGMIEAGKRSPTSVDVARLRAVFEKSGEERP